MSEAPDELLPTRRSLLSRLKDWDDQESWHEFFNTYWKLIYGTAIRAGLSDADAQDVVQETVISAAKQLPQFNYDPAAGSFKSWLRTITRRRIADHLRKVYRHPEVSELSQDEPGRTAELEAVPDTAPNHFEAIWEEEWSKHLLAAALARVKRKVDAKHFQIFDCYALKQWPVKEVARAFGVKAAEVYVIKHRVSGLLEKELQRLGTGPE